MSAGMGGAAAFLDGKKHTRRGEPMPCAIVLGCAPVAMFTGGMKLAVDLDEMAVAGGCPAAPGRVGKQGTAHPPRPPPPHELHRRVEDPLPLLRHGALSLRHSHRPRAAV